MAKTTRASQKRKRPKGSWRRNSAFYGEWCEFADSVKVALEKSINNYKPRNTPPYDEPSAVLKRMVYEFVIKNYGEKVASQIDHAIYIYREEQEDLKNASEYRVLRGIKATYASSPFYTVLSGLLTDVSKKHGANKSIKSSIGMLDITRDRIWRYALQLEYAKRQNVPPEYLIGFLYQSGTILRVCENAKDPNKLENWYHVIKGR